MHIGIYPSVVCGKSGFLFPISLLAANVMRRPVAKHVAKVLGKRIERSASGGYCTLVKLERLNMGLAGITPAMILKRAVRTYRKTRSRPVSIVSIQDA